jgi:hypothetical protein
LSKREQDTEKEIDYAEKERDYAVCDVSLSLSSLYWAHSLVSGKTKMLPTEEQFSTVRE